MNRRNHWLRVMFFAFLVLTLTACTAGKEDTNTDTANTNANANTDTDASSPPSTAASVADGTYEAVVESMKGEMKVRVTIKDQKMDGIEVDSPDTPHLMEAIKERVVKEMIAHQTVNVDSLSGATFSSAALKAGVKKALEEAGADVDKDFNSKIEVLQENREKEKVDVVVVGSGGAGLSTAIQLKENGIENVVLLEKLGYFGGTTSFSAGGIWTVGDTQFNKNTGYDYTPDELVDFIYESSEAERGALNESLIRRFADVSAEMFDYYYNEVGIPFNIELIDSFGDITKKMPVAWTKDGGSVLTSKMTAKAQELGVDMRLDSRVVELLSNDGAVTGVVVEDKAGSYEIEAMKVVLATGGIQRNKELLEKYAPEYVNLIPFTSAGSTGDAILLTRDLNAGIKGNAMGGMQGFGERFGYEKRGVLARTASIMINKDGERFINEGIHYSRRLLAFMQQKDGKAYGIGDGSNEEVWKDIEGLEKYGYAVTADSLEKLAELIEVDKEAMLASIELYNSDKEAGINDSKFNVPNENMTAIGDGPYYALKLDGVSSISMIGLKADEECRILNEDGNIIPNLYGAGEAISGNYLQTYYPGSGSQVGTSLFAGKIIADSILKNRQ